MNIDQSAFGNETIKQTAIADYYAYLELKKIGYTEEDLNAQFDTSLFKKFD